MLTYRYLRSIFSLNHFRSLAGVPGHFYCIAFLAIEFSSSWSSSTATTPSHLARAASLPLTSENGLARCVCYYLCDVHCRRLQSLSRRYATSTPKCQMLPLRYIAVRFSPLKNCPFPLGKYRLIDLLKHSCSQRLNR